MKLIIEDLKILKKVECQASCDFICKTCYKGHEERKALPSLLIKYSNGKIAKFALRCTRENQIYSLTQSHPYKTNSLEVKKCKVNETNSLEEKFQALSNQGIVIIKQNWNLNFQKSMKLKGGGCGSAKAHDVAKSQQQKSQSTQGTQQVTNQGIIKKTEGSKEVLETEEQKIYQEGLQLLSKGLKHQKMELVLQGIQTIQKNKLSNISDPLVLINQFIEIVSHKHSEG